MKKNKIFIFLGILFCIYISLNYLIGKNSFLIVKILINQEKKEIIKKYFFPYKFISQQAETITTDKEKILKQKKELDKIHGNLSFYELNYKKLNDEIKTQKIEHIKLDNGYYLEKHKLQQGFYSGINNKFPGSGYIDFYSDNIIILSSRGILAYSKKSDDKLTFKQIKNNINEFIGLRQFNKNNWFSLKDLKVYKDKVLISYTEEILPDCWNTSVLIGEMNYKEIKFKKLFSPNECVHSTNSLDGEFNASQSGGRIIFLDDDNILLSLGEFRSRHLAQDINSVNGKIIKINIFDSKFEILSKGHRNPQGLYLDKENNFVLETEHGPRGGDEINLIEFKKIKKNEVLNYGWPISSAGEHYGGKTVGLVERNKLKYEKYPLYKSHKKYGFIEPLKSFVPSIGISEITKIDKNKYVVSSMKEKSLYFFELNNKNKIVNLEKVPVLERVRDLSFKTGALYLFLEDTASIGIIKLN